MYKVKVVENGLEASNLVSELQNEGYTKDEVYIFAHGKDRSKDLTDATDTGEVGVTEQGLMDKIGNVFRKRGDELRSKIQSLGPTDQEAEHYEKELDEGRVVVIASKEAQSTPYNNIY